MESKLDYLPVLDTFDGIKRGDKVYSRIHGIGKVYDLYHDDELIVQFADLRSRILLAEREIALIPEEYLKKPKGKPMEVYIGNEKVSFKEFKRRREIEERRQKYEEDLKKMQEKEAKKGINKKNDTKL